MEKNYYSSWPLWANLSKDSELYILSGLASQFSDLHVLKKIMIIFCKDFHRKLIEHTSLMKEMGTISDTDHELFLVTDSIEEAVELIREKSIKHHGLKPGERVRPFNWLFESD